MFESVSRFAFDGITISVLVILSIIRPDLSTNCYISEFRYSRLCIGCVRSWWIGKFSMLGKLKVKRLILKEFEGIFACGT